MTPAERKAQQQRERKARERKRKRLGLVFVRIGEREFEVPGELAEAVRETLARYAVE